MGAHPSFGVSLRKQLFFVRSRSTLGCLIVVLVVPIGDHVVRTLCLRFQMVHQIVLEDLLRFLAAAQLLLRVGTSASLTLRRALTLSI